MPQDIKHWIGSELFNQVPVSISVVNRDFRIVEANRQFTETFGPWENLPCYKVYKDLKSRCERCAAVETFADGQMRTREEVGKDRRGCTHHYFVHMVPLHGSSGEIPYIVEMSTDITALKRLEQEKLEAERLAAIGQTVAGLAHGVKNIIMGLEGGIYVMGSGIRRDNSEKIKQGWEMLEENVARITDFVKEFLSFARGATPKVALTEPSRVARQVVELFEDKAALVGIELRSNLAADIPEAPMDADALHTCLANLVSNALDACEVSDKEERHVTVRTYEGEGRIVFEVSDNGCGMDFDVKQKVFTNFFTTKGSGQGTGLGLLTTRKIVQQHGGTVSFESTAGVGSVFRLSFPRTHLPEASA